MGTSRELTHTRPGTGPARRQSASSHVRIDASESLRRTGPQYSRRPASDPSPLPPSLGVHVWLVNLREVVPEDENRHRVSVVLGLLAEAVRQAQPAAQQTNGAVAL